MPKLYFLILLTISSFVSRSQTIYEVRPEDERHACFLYAEFGIYGKSDVKIVVFSSYIYRYKYSTGYSHPVLYDEDVRTRLKLAFYEKIKAIVNNERNANISYLPHQKMEWAYKNYSHAEGTGPELYQSVSSTTAFNRNVRSRILQDYRNKGYKIYQTSFEEFYDESVTKLRLENVEKLSALDYETYSPGCMKGIGTGSGGSSESRATTNQQSTSSRGQGTQNSASSSARYYIPGSVFFKASTQYKAGFSYYYNGEGIYYTFIFDRTDKTQVFLPWSGINAIESVGEKVRILATYTLNNRTFTEPFSIDIEADYYAADIAKEFKRLKAQYTGEPTEEEIAEVERRRIEKRLALVDKSKEGKLPTSSTKVTTSTLYYFIYAFDPREINGEHPTLYISNVFPISKYSDDTWPLPVVIEKETANLTIYKEMFSGFYTENKEAEARLKEMKAGFAESGGKVKEVTYNGKGKAASTNTDFWGNGTKKEEEKNKKNSKRDAYWDN